MKVDFIYWEHSSQQNREERFPYFALLLYQHENDADIHRILYFTHKKELIFANISKKVTHFTTIGQVEISYELYQSAVRHVADGITLGAFGDKFLSYVARFRKPIDEAEDQLRQATLDAGDQVLAQLSSNSPNQPFPRIPK
jgi:hypothetical protein